MSYSLGDIEKAVRANFVIKPDAKKFLDADPEMERDIKSVARMVFVGMAYGTHSFADIEAYSRITQYECLSLVRKYHLYYNRGKEKAHAKRDVSYDQRQAFDSELRVYRKVNLVKNYLQSLLRQTIVK